MIGIIDYEAGNIASVTNALSRLEIDYTVSNQTEELGVCDGYIFPGVGHALPAMNSLREHGLIEWIRAVKKPFLGICLGMQLLFEETEEGPCQGIGIIPGKLRKFDNTAGKVPHMGWNTFSRTRQHPLLEGLQEDDYFYYVHSYYAPVNEFTIAECRYLTSFAAVAARDNYCGVQFHPEKSGRSGERLLSNFLNLVQTRTSVNI